MTNQKINEIFSMFKLGKCDRLYNYDYISDYKYILSCMELIYDAGTIQIYETMSDGFSYLADKIINIIWKKISQKEVISSLEIKVFLCCFLFETVHLIGLKNEEIYFTFLDKNDPKIADCYGKHIVSYTDHYRHDIYYNNELIEILSDPTIDFGYKIYRIQTITHELIHAWQHKISFDGSFNLSAYICSLEQSFRNLNKDYYKNNYHFTWLESEAVSKSHLCILNFLIGHKLIDNKNANKLFEIEMNLKNVKEKNSLNNTISFNGIDDKVGHVMLMSLSTFLRNNKNNMSHYKLLSLSYNDDGSLMSITELFNKRLKLLSEYPDKADGINEIYMYIFSCYFSDKVDQIDDICKIYRYLEINKDDEFMKQVLKSVMKQKGASDEAILKLIKQSNFIF